MKNQDNFKVKQQQIAKSLIAQWNANETKLLNEYGSRSKYFIRGMAGALWKDPEVRDDFGHDFSSLVAYIRNENRVTDHNGKSKIFKKSDMADLNNQKSDVDILEEKFRNDSGLRTEFDDDLDAYLAYEKAMKHDKVRILNKR